MEDIKIIVASHGYFSKELIKSAEMITGPMKNIEAFSLLPNMETSKFRNEVTTAIDNDSAIIALVDLFGGTPANVLSSLIESYNIEVITGVSLPMLLELYFNVSQNQFNSHEDLINNTVKVGTEGIVHVNEFLLDREENDELD